MFEGCEHLLSRDGYRVISLQEACGGSRSFKYPRIETTIKQLQIKALKENKKLWVQLRPTDFRDHPRKPEGVSRMDIKFSTLPYQIADVVSLLFPDGTEMRLYRKYKVHEE